MLTDETDSADLYKQNARLKIIYIPWLPNMKPFYWLTEPTEPTNYGILVVLVPFYESGLGIGIYLMIHVTAILRHLMTYRSKNH